MRIRTTRPEAIQLWTRALAIHQATGNRDVIYRQAIDLFTQTVAIARDIESRYFVPPELFINHPG
ncbi:MAG TPA: hypothetical protein VI094_23090 [Propionibacteriaceae bacterium]